MRLLRLSWVASFVLIHTSSAIADERIEKNVVYAMLSGLALTMDVYFPKDSNKRGIVVIPGSAWDGRETGYSNWEVKAGYRLINEVRDELVRSGFTVFVPNHRMAPVFRFPAAVEDVQRVVRFIRHSALIYGIDGDALAAVGHSSGGYLCAMLGVLDDDLGVRQSPDPVERQSSKVKAVVSISAPYDLSNVAPFLMPFTVAFMGERPPMDAQWSKYLRVGRYAEASPVTHATPDDAAFLLIHATGDPNVSYKQHTMMDKALRNAGLPVETITIEADTHTPKLDHNMIVNWLLSCKSLPQRQTENLFNGKNLSGWHVDVPNMDNNPNVGNPFIVRNGLLVILDKPKGHLISDAVYQNYRIEVQYRFTAKPGNSGVLVHASTPRALYGMFPKSIEVQMHHKNVGDFWCILEDISVPDMVSRRGPKEKWGTTEGKARRILNLTDDSEKSVGEWNTMVIECLNNSIMVWVNDDLVNHGFDCTTGKGQIALQAEGCEIEFRKIQLTSITEFSSAD